MRAAGEASLSAEQTLSQAWERIGNGRSSSWIITDQSGVIAVVNRTTLEKSLAEDADRKLGDVFRTIHFPHLHSDQTFDLALERMGENQLDVLPVVNRANVHQLEGMVTLRDLLDAYGIGGFHS